MKTVRGSGRRWGSVERRRQAKDRVKSRDGGSGYGKKARAVAGSARRRLRRQQTRTARRNATTERGNNRTRQEQARQEQTSNRGNEARQRWVKSGKRGLNKQTFGQSSDERAAKRRFLGQSAPRVRRGTFGGRRVVRGGRTVDSSCKRLRNGF